MKHCQVISEHTAEDCGRNIVKDEKKRIEKRVGKAQ
jgi:hypothetical protein